jgi:mRNA interferase MazF
MSKVVFVPDRGDIVMLDFNPIKAHEQAGRRPALVLSPRAYNHVSGLMICCPITSTRRNLPFETNVPKSLVTRGVILAEHVRSVAWAARHATFLERVPRAVMDEVSGKLLVLIDPERGL